MEKEYLGDAVYVEFDGIDLVLTTENGIDITNRIVLEGPVFRALQEYARRVGGELYPIAGDIYMQMLVGFMIKEAMARENGHLSQAAQRLGVAQSTLQRRLKGIEAQE